MLPSLGANKENIVVAGISAGGFETAQLMMAYPDIFQCGGILNGGLPSSGARQEEYKMGFFGLQGKELDEFKEAQW